MTSLFAFGEFAFNPVHIAFVLLIGILFFGKKLPEIGRSLGKGIVEFRKGLKGLEDEVETTSTRAPESPALEQPRPPQRVVTNVPKFEDAPQNITPPQA
jgi:sec-independent protein translocase protein TatA